MMEIHLPLELLNCRAVTKLVAPEWWHNPGNASYTPLTALNNQILYSDSEARILKYFGLRLS